jgi:hypothetical protein
LTPPPKAVLKRPVEENKKAIDMGDGSLPVRGLCRRATNPGRQIRTRDC